MNIGKQEYQKLASGMSPKSPIWKDMLFAFLVGGAICTVGQLVQNGWKAIGLGKDEAGTATAISMVFLSAVLTALSVYDDIAKHAGAGTLVPITGFANAVVSPAMDFRADESDIIRPSQKSLEFSGEYDDSIQNDSVRKESRYYFKRR